MASINRAAGATRSYTDDQRQGLLGKPGTWDAFYGKTFLLREDEPVWQRVWWDGRIGRRDLLEFDWMHILVGCGLVFSWITRITGTLRDNCDYAA